MTPAEAVLWRELRGERLGGVHFRRQHPVGQVVLDFYCPAARLCIEVDGPVHDGQADADAARSAWLATHGIRTLRFRNHQVLTDLPTVLTHIQIALTQSE
jgi:very-short-patch-repair endonuclease